MDFTASTYQNEYLPAGATDVDAIVTVAATGAGGAGVGPPTGVEAAELLIVDTSGSMGMPDTKIRAARRATAAAVEVLRDGVWFAVISGDNDAEVIYPPYRHHLVQASESTRAEAKEAVRHLEASGGTAISTWLDFARSLFEPGPVGSIRHALLLTDGRNESESALLLDEVLERCKGQFQCDARGVGVDWDVAELRRISTALLGTVDIIPDPDEMETEFRSLIEAAMGKEVAGVSLRVWAPQGATVNFVRQVAPDVADLTSTAVQVNPLTRDYPLGSWGGAESRDYHISVTVKPGATGAEMLAARASVVSGDTVVSSALVRALWTDDEALSTRINQEVAHYTGQAELASAIQEGLEARKAGDDRTATVKLGRAVQLAHESGNEGTVRLLKGVVDVQDEESGTVRLRGDVEAADEMALDTRSTKTVRVGKS